MNSRKTNSLAASRRSQSQIRRWTCGRVTRPRSARGGKSPPRSSRAGWLLPFSPFLPHQEAVGQHHADRVAVEATPPPPLVLVPAQEPLGLLMVLLHPVPPVCILHHRFQRHRRAEVAPVVPPLAIGGILTNQPAQSATARPGLPPAADSDKSAPEPALAALPPRHRAPRPRRLRLDQCVGPLVPPAGTTGCHGEIGADGDHIPLAALLQALQEVGIVAVVGVGGHARKAHAPGPGAVQQVQGDLRLGLERHLRGHVGPLPSDWILGPGTRQVKPGGDRPSQRALGIMTVDGDLAVALLAQGAGVLTSDAHGTAALLGEAGVVEDQNAVSLAGKLKQLLDALSVEILLVPSRRGQQTLKLLLGGTGDARGDGITVLVGQLGQQPGEVAIQGMPFLAAQEMDMERPEELGQLWYRLERSLWNANGVLHTPLYA